MVRRAASSRPEVHERGDRSGGRPMCLEDRLRIADLSGHVRWQQQTADLLVSGFTGTGTTAWSTDDAARTDVTGSVEEHRISRVAVDENDRVLGWIAGAPEYDGHVWELN